VYVVTAVVVVVAIELAMLGVGCVVFATWSARSWCLLANAAGVALGWTIGTLCSPSDDEETTDFSKYASAFSGFVSGFAVSKIDRVFEEAAKAGVIATSSFLVPIVVFATTTLAAAIHVDFHAQIVAIPVSSRPCNPARVAV
jgi:hypothetical protein